MYIKVVCFGDDKKYEKVDSVVGVNLWKNVFKEVDKEFLDELLDLMWFL